MRRQARDAFTLAGCYFWSEREHPVEAGIWKDIFWMRWFIFFSPVQSACYLDNGRVSVASCSRARCGMAVSNKRALSPTMSRVLLLLLLLFQGLHLFSLHFQAFLKAFTWLNISLFSRFSFTFLDFLFTSPHLFLPHLPFYSSLYLFLYGFNAPLARFRQHCQGAVCFTRVLVRSARSRSLLPAKSRASSIM